MHHIRSMWCVVFYMCVPTYKILLSLTRRRDVSSGKQISIGWWTAELIYNKQCIILRVQARNMIVIIEIRVDAFHETTRLGKL